MANPTAIFLDTQAFEAASFNFKTTVLHSLEEQVQKGNVCLVLTDITVREVHARIEKNVRSQLDPLKKFRRDARVLRSSRVPQVQAALDLDEQQVIADLQEQFDDFVKRTSAAILDTSTVPAGPVLQRYFAGSPPFGGGDKKCEFPDAFALEALSRWVDATGRPVYVVSGDAPIRGACGTYRGLFPEDRLAQLLNQIVLQADLAAFLRQQVLLRLDEIKDAATEQFEDFTYSVGDEWGDAEMSGTILELKGEPEIIEADNEHVTFELRFDGTFIAELSYEDPSRSVYDNDTGRPLFTEQKHEVQRKKEEFVVEVKATFEMFNYDAFEVDETILTEPDSSYTVTTARLAGHPWK
jgi:hypothetical protein